MNSLIKYRGTQWALLTTFEPKNETSFSKMGVDCYDPFGYSFWPTYFEMLTIIFYIWCATFCFGHLISVTEIGANVTLHIVVIAFIVASTAAAICFVYLYLVKRHLVDQHYDSVWWLLLQDLVILFVIALSVGLWYLATKQTQKCKSAALDWLVSTLTCATILTLFFIFVYLILWFRKQKNDRINFAETDSALAKTSSKQNLEFSMDPMPSLWCGRTSAPPPAPIQATNSKRAGSKLGKNPTGKSGTRTSQTKPPPSNSKTQKVQQYKTAETNAPTAPEETLDNPFGQETKYIKTKNRNSISQYV